MDSSVAAEIKTADTLASAADVCDCTHDREAVQLFQMLAEALASRVFPDGRVTDFEVVEKHSGFGPLVQQIRAVYGARLT